jgi:small ligand-binding sensory domain FIST
MQGQPGHLAFCFVTTHHADGLGRLAAGLRDRGLARHVAGCTAESIVGDGREVEDAPAVSVWAVSEPNLRVTSLRLTDEAAGLDRIARTEEPADPANRILVLLGDPFTFPADPWLKHAQSSVPGLRVVGGMASAGRSPGQNVLVLDDDQYQDGAVAVLIDAPAPIRTVVSQGCRPIGRPMIVTKSDQNLIRELGRRPALEVLKETFAELDPAEQDLVRNGLHLGRVINEYQESFDRGDFLVRNVLGADESGAIAITDVLRVGQTVQFHVRDSDTADEDLATLLGEVEERSRVAGALLFTCNGRGARLFSTPDHDVSALRAACGPIPAAGFFAMGEIGPIGGQNFVHGFTASTALFERPG